MDIALRQATDQQQAAQDPSATPPRFPVGAFFHEERHTDSRLVPNTKPACALFNIKTSTGDKVLSFGKAGDKVNPFYFASLKAGNSGLLLIRFSPKFNGPRESAPEYYINLIEACESLIIDVDPPQSLINEHSVTPSKQHTHVKFKFRPGGFATLEANIVIGQTAAPCAGLATMIEGEMLVTRFGPQTAAWFETV